MIKKGDLFQLYPGARVPFSQLNHQGPFLPREESFLIDPVLTFFAKFEVEVVNQARDDETHFRVGKPAQKCEWRSVHQQ